MLQEDNVRRGFFERAHLEGVCAELPPPLRPVVRFAYLTGWRVASEILPLEWRQVDWNGRVVRLDPGTTKNRDGRTFPGGTRAGTERAVGEHERLQQADRLVARVFHRDGKPIKDFRAAFEAACEAAGCPGRLLHDFRRTAVRNLERDGVSRSAAMAMVGHKTESIYRRYAIVDAGALRDAAGKNRPRLEHHGHTFGHTRRRCTKIGQRLACEIHVFPKDLVPEEGIEPSRGVNPTGF